MSLPVIFFSESSAGIPNNSSSARKYSDMSLHAGKEAPNLCVTVLSLLSILTPILLVMMSYLSHGAHQSVYIAMLVDKDHNVKEQILMEAESIHADMNMMVTRGEIMYSCTLEDMFNNNTILVMNMEMKECDQALHDQQFLSKVARSVVRGVIILDKKGVNHRVSSPFHLWHWWIPDRDVMDKQVVTVKKKYWVQ